MKEPHGKGLANRSNPESCAGHGNMAGEALTRAHTGQPLRSEPYSRRTQGREHVAGVAACAIVVLCFDAFLMNFVFLSALLAVWQALVVLPLSFLKRNEETRSQRLRNVGISLGTMLVVCALVILNGHIAPLRADRLIDAIETYRRENGAYPEQLESLVPRYIDRIPTAQYTIMGEFHYQPHVDPEPILWYNPHGMDHRLYKFGSKTWHYLN